MGYSINSTTSDCYNGTTCLINKLGITDENTLAQIEADITFAKASQLEANPINGNFDFNHYKAIHEYLFSDLYDWAGKIRTVNISKKGTGFVDCSEIEKIANMCFGRLKNENYFKELEFNDFIESIVDFYCTTNMLHPFREGNGRTQRIFIIQLIRYCGYDIDFSEIDLDELMIATINSANGVTDMLKQIFKENIKQGTT
ncbi:MAG: Fic family protein [Clostridia bacterium]|nr:Fic family protein [Clostridia bacterium]